MIIFGSRTTQSASPAGTYTCPQCQTIQHFRHLVLRRWFTLYFIPVIPLGRLGEQLECQGCCSRFAPEMALEQPAVHSPAQSFAGHSPAANPFADKSVQPPTYAQPLAPRATPTTPLAVTSLILALVSPMFLCLCALSLFPSLGAVITGHLALSTIKRSPTPLAGRGLAIAGLSVGYCVLLLSLAYWGVIATSIMRDEGRGNRPVAQTSEPETNSAEERLHEAELKVMAEENGRAASGNSPAAEALARRYSHSLRTMRDMLFTPDEKRVISLTKGQFIVHCELHDNSCAFIVHVPSYRHFSDDAKETLEQQAWRLAQQSLRGRLQSQGRLAVGLRGTLLYGAVLTGNVADNNMLADQPYHNGEREDLLAFFVAPTWAEEPEPLATAPPAAPYAEVPPPAERVPAESRGVRRIQESGKSRFSDRSNSFSKQRTAKGLSMLEDESAMGKQVPDAKELSEGQTDSQTPATDAANRSATDVPTTQGLSELEATSPAQPSKENPFQEIPAEGIPSTEPPSIENPFKEVPSKESPFKELPATSTESPFKELPSK